MTTKICNDPLVTREGKAARELRRAAVDFTRALDRFSDAESAEDSASCEVAMAQAEQILQERAEEWVAAKRLVRR